MKTDYSDEILKSLKDRKETVWINKDYDPAIGPDFEYRGYKFIHMKAAQSRLMRFMPYIESAFPETGNRLGIIESELLEADKVSKKILATDLSSKVFIKDDAHLPISGSVKARGGIYEVLKHAEELALSEKLINPVDSRACFDSEQFHQFFSQYTIQVGSTGNLGLSIGIMGAKLGFKVIVHMSKEARAWKKNMLRECGVNVIEYEEDYTAAVKNGREISKTDPLSYFIDDESSTDLFFGYSTAALRLKVQLRKRGITVDEMHPLVVYIPCGVGGAPGGITFGLKQLFGNDVKVYFVEPVNAPCFMLSMISKQYGKISVGEIGLDGKTIADGLAVNRASKFVSEMMKPLVSGSLSVCDERLIEYQKIIKEDMDLYLEPSATAGFAGFEKMYSQFCKDATHVIWATGGGMVPKSEREI